MGHLWVHSPLFSWRSWVELPGARPLLSPPAPAPDPAESQAVGMPSAAKICFRQAVLARTLTFGLTCMLVV